MLKIATIVGARPQFIKAAVVSRALWAKNSVSQDKKRVVETIIHTGQHYDYNMSQVFFDELEIPKPAYNLQIGSGSHSDMTGNMLKKLGDVLADEKPDCVIVYGDTNTTLSGAIASAKLNIPLAHVEAGLRSFNRGMPEEINRVLTDHASTLLFCPTQQAMDNLSREGIGVDNGHQHALLVGDVMVDAARYYLDKAGKPSIDRPYALASIHRAENTDDILRLESILAALGHSPIPVLLPLHPRTRKVIKEHGTTVGATVTITDPFSYLTMLGHLQSCSFVITDSGGLQKEAFFMRKKCITTREETEWTELVAHGVNRLVGSRQQAIQDEFEWALQAFPAVPRLYGNADAGHRIAAHLLEFFDK